MKRLSASKIELFQACQYGWRDDVPWRDDPTNEAAIRGNWMHAVLEYAANGGSIEAAIASADEKVSGFSDHAWANVIYMLEKRDPRSPINTPGAMTEVAIGSNGKIGEILPPGLERNYPDRIGWVWGTADVVIDTPECLRIVDYKTGSIDNVQYARENMQLLWLAGAWLIAKNEQYSRTKKVILELRIIEPNNVIVESREQTVGYCRWLPENTARKIISVNHAIPVVNKGCRFCLANHVCPTAQAMFPHEESGLTFPIPNTSLEIRNDEHAAYLVHLTGLGQGTVKHLKMITEEYAKDKREFPTRPGYVFKGTSKTDESIDERRAIDIIRELGERAGVADGELEQLIATTRLLREYPVYKEVKTGKLPSPGSHGRPNRLLRRD